MQQNPWKDVAQKAEKINTSLLLCILSGLVVTNRKKRNMKNVFEILEHAV